MPNTDGPAVVAGHSVDAVIFGLSGVLFKGADPGPAAAYRPPAQLRTDLHDRGLARAGH